METRENVSSIEMEDAISSQPSLVLAVIVVPPLAARSKTVGSIGPTAYSRLNWWACRHRAVRLTFLQRDRLRIAAQCEHRVS